MYREDLKHMSDVSRKKVDYLLHSPGGYFIFIGPGRHLFGIRRLFDLHVGAPFSAQGSAALNLVMGVSFGIGLTLVIFAGSELFTSNTMVCTIGALSRAITWKYVGWIFVWSFIGNLAGSLAVSWADCSIPGWCRRLLRWTCS